MGLVRVKGGWARANCAQVTPTQVLLRSYMCVFLRGESDGMSKKKHKKSRRGNIRRKEKSGSKRFARLPEMPVFLQRPAQP